MQGFVNALQDVANDPSSTASREALLSEARNLVARLEAMDQRLNEIAGEVRTRMGSAADRITALGADLAEINRQLIAAGTAAGRPAPAELLDQRDRLLEELAGLVQVNATRAERRHDERVHRHRAGARARRHSAQLVVTPGNADPLQPQVVVRGFGPDVNVTHVHHGRRARRRRSTSIARCWRRRARSSAASPSAS